MTARKRRQGASKPKCKAVVRLKVVKDERNSEKDLKIDRPLE